jgi:antitoxin HigA-1
MEKVTDVLNKALLWDIDPEKLDWEQNKQFIVERVRTRGFTKDVKLIFSRYTKDEVRSIILNNKTLDKKTANYMGYYLSIPLSSIPVASEYF